MAELRKWSSRDRIAIPGTYLMKYPDILHWPSPPSDGVTVSTDLLCKRSFVANNHIEAVRCAGQAGGVNRGFNASGDDLAERCTGGLQHRRPLSLLHRTLKPRRSHIPTGGIIPPIDQREPVSSPIPVANFFSSVYTATTSSERPHCPQSSTPSPFPDDPRSPMTVAHFRTTHAVTSPLIT